MTPVQIREFQYPQDYGQAARLWQTMEKGVRFSGSDAPEEIEKKLRRDPDLFLVAESGGEIVATVIGGFDGRRGLIYHLAVDSAFRGQGIGSRLMDEVERRLRAKGCRRAYLHVTVDNHEAVEYYEKRGWQLMDTVFTYGKDFD